MLERIAVAAGDAERIAGHVRGFVPAPGSVSDRVSGIIASVREGGDAQLIEHERRFGAVDGPLRVPAAELAAALAALAPEVRAGLELARANVGRVAAAGLVADRDVELDQGQRI